MASSKKRKRATSEPPTVGIGLQGSRKIFKALAEEGPIRTIPRIQSEHGLRGNDYEAMLQFLNVLGVRRGEIYEMMMKTIRANLEEAIEKRSIEEAEKIFRLSLPYVHAYELRPVVNKALSRMGGVVPEEFLPLFSTKYKGLEVHLPPDARRQVWEANSEAALRQLNDLLKACVTESSQTQMSSIDSKQPKSLLAIGEAVGGSWSLYQTVLKLLRGGFAHSANSRYCQLRLDLLLSLPFQSKGQQVYDKDPCSKLSTALQTCIRSNKVATDHAKSITKMVYGVPNNHPVLGDMAMMLNHPRITILAKREIVKYLGSLVVKKALPRSAMTDLSALSKIVLLSLNAAVLIKTRKFTKPKLEDLALKVFYTAMVSLLGSKLLGEEPPDLSTILTLVRKSSRSSHVAQHMLLPFLGRAARTGDMWSVKVLLPAMAKGSSNSGNIYIYIHIYIYICVYIYIYTYTFV
ncbi:hypothetical protein AAMO2058_000615100 [Amorphochlora amoebiformis]